MIIRITRLGMPDQNDGQQRAQEPGRAKRRTIYVLVYLGVTSVEMHWILLHGIGFSGIS